MATSTNLNVVITAKDEASAVVKQVGETVNKTGMDFASVGIAAGAALAIVLAFAKGALDAAQENEAAQAQLGAVLKSTGMAAGFGSAAANDLSEALAKQTTFSHEAVLGVEDLLLTFTAIGQKVMPQATATVLDMATALGEDTKSAAIQLGKALQDPVLGMTALRKVGVNFSKDQIAVVKQMVDTGQAAKAQQFILAELNKEFGGSAAAAAETFGGQMKTLGNQLNDVEQSIGEAMIPTLDGMLAMIKPVVKSIGDFISANPELAATLIALIITIAGATAAFAAYNSVIIPAIAATGAFLAVLGPVMLIVVAFGAAASLAAAAISHDLNKSFDDAIAKSKAFQTASHEIVMHIHTLRDSIQKTTLDMKDLADKTAAAGQAVADMQQQISDATKAHASTQADIKQSMANDAIAQEQKVGDLTQKISDETAKYQKDMQKGMSQDQMSAAEKNLNTLNNQLAQEKGALTQFYDQNKNLTAQLTEAKRRASLTDFERQVEDLKKQAAINDAQYQVEVSRLNKKLGALQAELGKAQQAEADYTKQYKSQLDSRLADLKDSLKQAAALMASQTPAPVFGGGFPLPSFSMGGMSASTPSFIPHAMGGSVEPGQTYLVGEQGPELFSSAVGGSIIPNHAMGGGSTVINITGTFMSEDAAVQMSNLVVDVLKRRTRVGI